MKGLTTFQTCVACVLSVAIMISSLSACQSGKSPASQAQFTPHKFCPDDAVVNGVRIGSSPDQVKAALGEPEDEFTEDHPWYSQRIGMMYDGFDLDFYDI